MNIDQWIHQVSDAYQSIGQPFSSDKKTFLLTELLESMTQEQKDTSVDIVKVIFRFFFKKASLGEAFGSLNRVEEKFGRSLEENYGLSDGPFLKMAKTYWTFKLEIQDLFPEHHNLILSDVLLRVENDIAGVFFPTPGPSKIPVDAFKEAQRNALKDYAPDIDVETFLSESPILRAEAGRGGCLGMIVLMVLIPAGLLLGLYLLLS